MEISFRPAVPGSIEVFVGNELFLDDPELVGEPTIFRDTLLEIATHLRPVEHVQRDVELCHELLELVATSRLEERRLEPRSHRLGRRSRYGQAGDPWELPGDAEFRERRDVR